jgi:hypothetical protein
MDKTHTNQTQDQPEPGRDNQVVYWNQPISKEKMQRSVWAHDEMLLNVQQRKQLKRRI